MTREEVNTLINTKIVGQGTNVDAGSVLPDILGGIMGTSATLEEVDDFEEFDDTTPYVSGDIVRHQGRLYKANQSHTGAWVASHFTQTSVFSILSDTITALTTRVSALEG